MRVRAAEARNDKAAADRLIVEALALAAPQRSVRSLLDEGPGLVEILQRTTPMSVYARPYLDKFGAFSEEAGETRTQGPLSKTETSILELVAQGMSNREIAHRLSITVGTTK
ncbi:hypothetical protein AC629_24230 [Bradyrhizobium sp. NAS80.1]|nr:hypothetical protein AC629_24230 [Bradyrhizobium sp. NAS80.1]